METYGCRCKLKFKARAAGSVFVSKVKGHAIWQEVRQGIATRQDKIGNDFVDYLARGGVSKHIVDRECAALKANSLILTEPVQRMMVHILEAKASTMQTLGVQWSETDDSDESDDSGYTGSGPSEDSGIEVIHVESDSSEDSVEIIST